MKILTLGSINIDFNYSVAHITTPKETQASTGLEMFPGGKGMNHALTLARAGMEVQLAGMIGEDGVQMLQTIQDGGVDTSLVRVIEGEQTGHAIIQVDEVGQNAILLYGGANRRIDEAYVDEVLEQYGEGDILVSQNEISCLEYILNRAHEKGMYIVLNPSPCTPELLQMDLSKVSLFFLNEVEGRAMTSYVQPGDILIELEALYPDSEFVLTLGAQGAFYKKGASQCYHPSVSVPVVDTTAAGDVFEGYFLAAYLRGQAPTEALRYATYAAGLAISRPGAAYFSAPTADKVEEFMKNAKNKCAK
ncbi:MAG TPA: ribokinase [Candidatus Butyricicoccus stercorigallinarum]|nr:ribokinase [Candidatus Butyricicoccus stercorigallinarum]